MFKTICLFLCISYLTINSNAYSVSFIDKCKWDDNACLLTSAQKALPYFTAGIPELGMPPLDPIHIPKAQYVEGGLSVFFKNVDVIGARNCQMKHVERNLAKSYLIIKLECPFDVHGDYQASGDLLGVPLEGDGPFNVKIANLFLSMKVALTSVDGKDGEKYWKIGKTDYTYDFKSDTTLEFKNLFNGDQEKAKPVEAILKGSPKELASTIGKPLLEAVVNVVVEAIKFFTKRVTAKELEQ